MIKQPLRNSLILSDPFLSPRLRKWHWPDWLPSIIVLGWSSVGLFLIAALLGYLHRKGQIYGTLDVPSELAVSLIFQPITIWYGLSFPLRAVKTLDGLVENGVIRPEDYDQFAIHTERIARSWSSRFFYYSCLAFSVGIAIWVTAFAFDLRLGYPFWMHYFQWPFLIFEVPQAFIVTYLMGYTIFRIFVLHRELSALLSSIAINVQPLHPDGAGGLSPIGNLVGSYLYWLLAVSIFVTHAGWAAYFQYGRFPAYVIMQFFALPLLILLAFFLPLNSAHIAMEKAKRLTLESFNVQFAKKFASISTKAGQDNSYKDINDIIDASKRLRGDFPTWPFSTEILGRASLSIVASCLPLLYSFLETYLNKFLR